MNITVLSPTPPYRSGLSHYVVYLYSEFNKSHVINIITNKDSNLIGSKNIIISKTFTPGIKALWVSLLRLLMQKADILHIHVEYAFLGNHLNFLFLPLLILVLKIAKKGKIIITLHGIPNYHSVLQYLKQILKIPTIISIPLSLAYSIFSYLSIYLAFTFSSGVIVHTELMKNVLISFMPQKVRSKIYVIPHGAYEPPSSVEKHECNKDFIIILTIGYQRPSKGLETLLKAAKEISYSMNNVKFMIVGKHIWTWLEGIKKRTNYDKVQIEIIDNFLEDRDLDNIIRMADILVLPYEDLFYEVSGALHRVALFGKPLVCSNIPRFNSCLVNEKDAILFTPGNHIELVDRICRLINDPSLRKRLSKELVKKFSSKKWKLIAREHEQLFLKLINDNNVKKQIEVI